MSEPCTRFIESMSAYIDAELPADEAGALEAHLSGCARCRFALEEMRACDEGLRAAIAREPDSRSEGQALEHTIARLRNEPAPAWAAARRRSRWNWSVTLRWSAGLAAAAAAVLLVMRLGPTPTAPIRMRAIPPSQQVTVPAPAGPAPSSKVGVRPQEVAKPIAETPARPPARDERAEATAPVEKKTERRPAAEPNLAAEGAEPEESAQTAKPAAPTTATPPANVAQSDQGKSAAGGPPSSTPAPAPSQQEPYAARETREVPPERRAQPERPSPTARAAAPAAAPERGAMTAERAPKAPTPPKDGSILGLVKSTLSGDVYRNRGGAAPMGLDDRGSPPPWYMTVAASDTTIPDRSWESRLEDADIEMVSEESAKLPAAERARRYRAIGDLWEWFGRSANDPFASVRALASYRLAVRSDAQAAALDSTRVQRARAAVAGLSKATPAYR